MVINENLQQALNVFGGLQVVCKSCVFLFEGGREGTNAPS